MVKTEGSKKQQLSKKRKLNENRGWGKFINFAKIEGKFINFAEIEINAICIIDLGGRHLM